MRSSETLFLATLLATGSRAGRETLAGRVLPGKKGSRYESEGRVFESPWAHSGIPRRYTAPCYQNSAVVAKRVQVSEDGLCGRLLRAVEHVERARSGGLSHEPVRPMSACPSIRLT